MMSETSQWADLEMIPMDLYTASSVGCEERVREIIMSSKPHTTVNNPNKDGWTALMYAAYSGDHNVVKCLLEKGASPTARDRKGLTPLMLAANCGNTDSASLLIEAGSDVNAKDNQNWTALFYASSTGHRSVVQILVEKGARINIMEEKDGMTPLMLAAGAGHEMIVKDLLQYGASISISSKRGETARSLAVRNGHAKVKSAIDAYLFLQRNYSPSIEKSKESHSKPPSDVRSLLESIGLSKYYPVFQSHGIDMSLFWTLTDAELKEMGIELLGPRKKIAMAISRYKASQSGAVNASDAQLLIDKLIDEQKTLQQKVSELSKVLAREENLRVSTELQLAESIRVLQSFTEKVSKICTQLIHSEEGARNVLYSLKQVLSGAASATSSQSHQMNSELNLSNAVSLINLMENLIEDIHCKTLMLV